MSLLKGMFVENVIIQRNVCSLKISVFKKDPMQVAYTHGMTKDVIGLTLKLEGIGKVCTALKKVGKGLHWFLKS